MKGISWPFIGLIFTLVIALSILVPTRFLTIPLVKTIKYEENYNNAQMILISLLSSTENKKTIQQLLGEHIVLGEPNENDIKTLLEENLNKLVESKCYMLSTSSKTLVKSTKVGCNPEKYTEETEIVLPYNKEKLTEKLILVIE